MVRTDETAASDLVLVLNWMDELAAADGALGGLKLSIGP